MATPIEQKPRGIISEMYLPPNRKPAKYEVPTEGDRHKVVTLKDRKRQVVDAMLYGPLCCASTVRLGDAVFHLKEDHGLNALTLSTGEGRKFYSLQCLGVSQIDEGAV